MYHKHILALLLFLLCSCSASEPPAVDSLNERDFVEPATETPDTLLDAEVTVTHLATVKPPPQPSPVPTVTAKPKVPGAPMETLFFPPYDDRFRYIGRFDFDNPQGPAFDWSGSAVEFSFAGTGLAIHLADGRNLYNVLIDGQNQVLQTEQDREVYRVAEGLEPGEHSFRLSKRTEAYVGAGVFKGAEITGTLSEIQPGIERRLEFIGDSITAGYGIEGESPECWFTLETENADRSYAAITARALDAHYTLIAMSGVGVVRNLRADSAVSEITAVDFVDRTLGLNPFIIWPPERNTPDAVAINLGTNDYSSEPFPDDDVFIAAYLELLQAVRDRYPEAVIFAIAGPLMLHPAPTVIAAAVEQFRSANNDGLVEYVLIDDNLQRSAEDFGCDWHPNVHGHEKIAARLTPAIAETLGW